MSDTVCPYCGGRPSTGGFAHDLNCPTLAVRGHYHNCSEPKLDMSGVGHYEREIARLQSALEQAARERISYRNAKDELWTMYRELSKRFEATSNERDEALRLLGEARRWARYFYQQSLATVKAYLKGERVIS